jgi:hypothetical protein
VVHDNDEMKALENKWIIQLDSKNNGYNNCQAKTTEQETLQQAKVRYQEGKKEEEIKQSVKARYQREKAEGRYSCETCIANLSSGSQRDLNRHLAGAKHKFKEMLNLLKKFFFEAEVDSVALQEQNVWTRVKVRVSTTV